MSQQWPGQEVGAPQPQQQLPPVVTPQPFPGARALPSFPTQGTPMRQMQQQRTQQQLDLDRNQDRRAEDAAIIQQQAAQIAAEKAARERENIAANSGVETRERQDTVAGHLVTLDTELRILGDVKQQDPTALVPSWGEKLMGSMTQDPDYLSFTKNEQRQRASAAYRNVIESTLWLKTGAAYNDPQFQGQVQALVPQMNDQPQTLADKELRLRAVIEGARAQAGPGNVKVQEAMDRLETWLPQMYGSRATAATNDPGHQPEYKLSAESATEPIPPQMQADYEAAMGQIKPGTLTLDAYTALRQQIDRKYGRGIGTYSDAQPFVDAWNKGHATMQIPGTKRELTAAEAVLSGAGADEGIVGDLYTGGKNFANAMTLGLPELLSGREGRRASDLADEAHSKSALTGEILGSLVPSVGAERLALKGMEHIAEGPVAQRILSEVAGNAGYGAVRGANEGEAESRGWDTITGAGLGAVAPLVARGAVRGARGFTNQVTGRAIDDLGRSGFDIPGNRVPLPADDVTPPRYQGMSDDELRAEASRARQGVDAWGAQSTAVGEVGVKREALQRELTEVMAHNEGQQKAFLRQTLKPEMTPEQVRAVEAEAAQRFPTDQEGVARQIDFGRRMDALQEPSMGGLEPKRVLEERAARLDQHLSQDATPRKGEIPAVDLTTMQRMGLASSEEALQGVPFVSNAREKAVESWNLQNSARVLSKIGEELPKGLRAGQDANAFVNGKLNTAYSALRSSIQGRLDSGFNNSVAALRREAIGSGSEERTMLWNQIEEALQKFRKPDGTFDGTGYREFSTQLRRLGEVWTGSNNPSMTTAAQDMARVAEKIRRQGQALVSRANPAVGRRLKQLEAAWAQQVRIDLASRGAAKATRGVYAPDEYLSAIERLDTSRNKAAISRGTGLDQPYAQSAREAIGGKPAKKASIQQTAAGSGMLYFGGPLATAAATALGAGYTPGVKRVVQAIAEGALGKTPRAVIEKLQGSRAGDAILEGISTDARQRLLQQLIRIEAHDATK